MKRLAATALLVALGTSDVCGEEQAWGPSAGQPATSPATPAVPLAKPIAPVFVEPPTPNMAALPTADMPGWLPARRYPTDIPPKPTPPLPQPEVIPAVVPAPLAVETPFKIPVESSSPAMLPSVAELPSPISTVVLQPPVDRLPEIPKPAPAPITPNAVKPKSDLLDVPKPQPAPATPPTVTTAPGYTVHLAEPTPTAYAPPAAASGNAPVAPMRHGLYGSPSLNLSRDDQLRDIFGRDLMTTEMGAAGPLAGGTQDLLFIRAELLLWWQNPSRIPALATTSTSPTGSGFLGDPQTVNLLGPGDFGPSFLQGFRVRAGGYVDDCGMLGLDGGYFFLGPGRESRSFDSGQNPVITRPFFTPNLNAEFGEVVARPGLSAGRLAIEQDSFLWGIDINIRKAICRDCTGGHGWFLGYRHLNLTENLSITEFITANGPQAPDPVGTQVIVNDTFRTQNQFHGAQVGYWNQRRLGLFDLDTRFSLAMGNTNQVVEISGFQNRTRPGQATESFVGGLLAAGPNIGTFSRNAFSVVPEVTVNLGLFISPNVRLYAGYNFLYWSNVVRPGDQIDRVIDLTNVPNPPPGVTPSNAVNRPQPTFRASDFWAQGVQLGAELRW